MMPTRSRFPINPVAEALIARFERMTAQELRRLAEMTAAYELTSVGADLPGQFLSAKTTINEWALYNLRLKETTVATDLTLRADAALDGAQRDKIAFDAQMALVYAVTAVVAESAQPQIRHLLAIPWDSFVADAGHPELRIDLT